jgi:hypothetical protein
MLGIPRSYACSHPSLESILHALVKHIVTVVDHAIMINLGVAASKASSSTPRLEIGESP